MIFVDFKKAVNAKDFVNYTSSSIQVIDRVLASLQKSKTIRKDFEFFFKKNISEKCEISGKLLNADYLDHLKEVICQKSLTNAIEVDKIDLL